MVKSLLRNYCTVSLYMKSTLYSFLHAVYSSNVKQDHRISFRNFLKGLSETPWWNHVCRTLSNLSRQCSLCYWVFDVKSCPKWYTFCKAHTSNRDGGLGLRTWILSTWATVFQGVSGWLGRIFFRRIKNHRGIVFSHI